MCTPDSSCGANGRLIVREIRSPGGTHAGVVTELAFSADGHYLVVGTRNFAVRLWGVISGKVELFAPPLAGSNENGGYHAGKLSCDVVVNPARGLLMVAGSSTGGVIVWDCLEGCRAAELRNNGHPYGIPIPHLAAYPGGRGFVSADMKTIKVWCADTLVCERTLKSAFVVKILLVSSEGRFIFCAGQTEHKKTQRGVVAVWRNHHPDREPVRLLCGFGRDLRSLYVPDISDLLVTAGQDGRAKVWDVPSGECTQVICSKGAARSPLAYAALVNRRRWLLTSFDDASLQVWSMDKGKCLMTLATTPGITPRLRLAASRCGRLVAAATGERIQVIDFNTLADHSKPDRPGGPGAYLKHALHFIVVPTTLRPRPSEEEEAAC